MPRRFSKEEYDRIRQWGHDATDNGVLFDWGLAGPDGAWFTLIREPHHTDADIAVAKRQLYNDRDVVSLSVGVYDPAVRDEVAI
jgi:hypothetical protein